MNYYFITVFKILGLYPLHEDSNFTILWTFYSVTLGVIFILISIRALEEERHKIKYNNITSIVGTLQDLLMVFTECVWILGAVFYKKSLKIILDNVSNIDLKLLNAIWNDVLMNKYWKKVFIYEILVIILLIIFRSVIYNYINPYSDNWLSVATYLSDLLVIINTIQFCNYSLLLKQKFKLINKQVKKLRYVTDKDVLVKELSVISNCHAVLSDTLKLLSDAFSLQMLCVITNIFLRTLLTLFLDVKLLLGVSYFPVETIIVVTVWTVIFIVNLMFILHCCTSAKEEGVLTGILIHRLISRQQCYDDSDGGEQSIMLSLQLLHRLLDFSVCGMFPLDFTVIYNVGI